MPTLDELTNSDSLLGALARTEYPLSTSFRHHGRELAVMLKAITSRITVVIQLPAFGGLVPIHQLGYFRSIEFNHNESVNLISFGLDEVYFLISNLDCKVKKTHMLFILSHSTIC